jgi:hypothetical protein
MDVAALLIFLGAPWVEALRENRTIQHALATITADPLAAAVVGAVYTLAQ